MDVFDDLLPRSAGARARCSAASTLTAPWSLHFVDGAPLTLCTVLDGAGWIVPEHGDAEPLRAYDTVVVRGPATFTFVDELGTAAEPIACGEFCATPELGGTRHRLGWHDVARDEAGATTLIVGAYPVRGEISRRLLDALPIVLRVDGGGTGDAVLDHLAAEVAARRPRPAGGARPAAGLDAGVHAARVVRPARRRAAGLVGRPARPGGR